jgi:hypothetical protein
MTTRPPLFTFDTYAVTDLTVSTGANLGDPIGSADAAIMGDIYLLLRTANCLKISICDSPCSGQEVADGSQIGTPGDKVTLELCHTLMAPDGSLVELLLLKLTSDDDTLRLILPLATLEPNTEYELLETEVDAAPRRFADIASVSFLGGTHLTLADGRQTPVEDLLEGDRLLTRDHGVQTIRWIGNKTVRATGSMAPVRICEGTLNVARDLRLSPHHRLFIFQRHDEIGAGRAEVMVKAGYLLNGQSVVQEKGGFIDTYTLLFDHHVIIYAEGIAVESLLVTDGTRAGLPKDIKISRSAEGRLNATTIEVTRSSFNDEPEDAVVRLTRASRGQIKPR